MRSIYVFTLQTPSLVIQRLYRCSESVDKMFAYEKTWVVSTTHCDTDINERLMD